MASSNPKAGTVTDDEFKRVRATMPWTEHNFAQGRQTLIKIVDNAGREVPLLTITAFVVHMSALLARVPEKENKDA
jgi:hypothetical protein